MVNEILTGDKPLELYGKDYAFLIGKSSIPADQLDPRENWYSQKETLLFRAEHIYNPQDNSITAKSQSSTVETIPSNVPRDINLYHLMFFEMMDRVIRYRDESAV